MEKPHRYTIQVRFIGGATLTLADTPDTYAECISTIKNFVGIKREYARLNEKGIDFKLSSIDGKRFQLLRIDSRATQYKRTAAGLCMMLTITDSQPEGDEHAYVQFLRETLEGKN